MAPDAIVFAMANPTPEVAPEEVEHLAAVVATGRSDYPNQINNVLAFPGVFRAPSTSAPGRSRARWSSPPRSALAGVVDDDHLAADYIVPSVFNRDVAPAVAEAVAAAARTSGAARREPLAPASVVPR